MTTSNTKLPSARPFTPDECVTLIGAGLISEGEQAAVLAGKRRFTVDESLAMLDAGVLHEDDRIELIDGVLLVMAPIGDYHDNTADWLNELCVRTFGDRARVRVQGSIRLNNMSAPQPDIAILRRRALGDMRPFFPQDIFLVIEIADSSLRYDSGPKLAMYAAAGIPEVWIANLRSREVTAHISPAGSVYTSVHTYGSGDSISPGAFPDVSLAIDEFMPPAPGPEVEVA